MNLAISFRSSSAVTSGSSRILVRTRTSVALECRRRQAYGNDTRFLLAAQTSPSQICAPHLKFRPLLYPSPNALLLDSVHFSCHANRFSGGGRIFGTIVCATTLSNKKFHPPRQKQEIVLVLDMCEKNRHFLAMSVK